ncbi:hypothetical protein SISSUDRAFT_1120222 [Sistotremastrum suecicum HHB10207 ss-3]|uniref:Uncharacterized protein n=1 Tax=Sistotremastrum suecicum HHB10207 ss-3 TaxID=1314776 RepID=A0A166CL85_9AGAM|nr:hypothetical protein SISSUDRAFT_1120222 [Sistotremastrum suecicum HHB10207 ss-3]
MSMAFPHLPSPVINAVSHPKARGLLSPIRRVRLVRRDKTCIRSKTRTWFEVTGNFETQIPLIRSRGKQSRRLRRNLPYRLKSSLRMVGAQRHPRVGDAKSVFLTSNKRGTLFDANPDYYHLKESRNGRASSLRTLLILKNDEQKRGNISGARFDLQRKQNLAN